MSCGLRIGEALGLQREDVVVQGSPVGAVVLLLRRTKTAAADIERVVLSHPVLVEVIEEERRVALVRPNKPPTQTMQIVQSG